MSNPRLSLNPLKVRIFTSAYILVSPSKVVTSRGKLITAFQQTDLCSCNSVITTAQSLAWGQPSRTFPGKFRARRRGSQRPLAAALSASGPQLVKGFPAPPKKHAVAMNPPGRSRSRGGSVGQKRVRPREVKGYGGTTGQGCLRTTTPRVQRAAAARARQ